MRRTIILLLVPVILGGVVPGGSQSMAQTVGRSVPGTGMAQTDPQTVPGADMPQTDISQWLQRQWATLRSTHLDEKIFVHTDKDFYLTGEVCWFKCYDVSALSLRPLDLSKVGYVEVLDTSGRPVLQAKIGLTGGSGSGSFYLPFTLASGTYTLRSYTNWMKNSPPELFFRKKLTVINTREAGSGAVTPTASESGVHTQIPATARQPGGLIGFFPEGGNLVNGLPSVVAFKGTDAYGDPIDFTGILLDEKNDTLLNFSPLTQGMGHFSFTPAAGHSYRALIRVATASVPSATAPAQPAAVPADFTVALPEVYVEGYVMHLDTAKDGEIAIDVRTNKTGEGTLYLFVHTRGSLRIAEGKTPTDGHVVFRIDKSRLGEGISHLTVFNSARQPVCERLYFRYPSDKVRLALATDREEYDPREPVIVRVGIPEEAAQAERATAEGSAQAERATAGGSAQADADLSMSVYRLDSLQGIDPSNIYSYLWLTSDLTGPIASPDYYFDRPGPETAAAMDNLMLTQGWRRFRWESVLNDDRPSFTYPPEFKGHIISGTIVDTRTGRPVPDLEGFLSVPGKRSQFTTARSDSSGRVAFEMRNMYGSSEIIVQTNLAVDSLDRIDIDDPFSQVYPRRVYPPFREPLQNPVTISEHNLSMQIQNAYAAMRAQQLTLPALDSSAFYLHPDLTYNLDDYTRFTTMEEVLREYVQLVNVSRRGLHYHLWTFDAPHATPFDDDPQLLLDGVPIFNTDQLMQFDPFKIRKVDVLTRRYFLGASFFDGLVNWVTYKGDLSGYQLDPHAIAVDYEGLQDKREFYSPAYVTPVQKASRLPDFRNVLYWDPSLPVTPGSAEGKPVRFYTSDMPGKYIVVVQGISSGGAPLYGTTTIEVH
jgi:hypothetical protein